MKPFYSQSRKLILVSFLIVVLLTAIIGCSNVEKAPDASGEETTVPSEEGVNETEQEEEPVMPEAPEAPAESESETIRLPDSIETTFLLEGMEEAITLMLFDESEFPFYTYYPEDFLPEIFSESNAVRVLFYTNYGDTINREAYMGVTVYQQGFFTSQEDFLHEMSGEGGKFNRREYEWIEKEASDELMYDWTIREYFFMSDEFTGAIFAGLQDDQFFYIETHHPWEFGDGFGPRANLILETFTWRDPSEPLIR